MHEEDNSNTELIDAINSSHRRVSSAQRDLLALIAEVDRRRAWRDSGARDMPHWLSMHLGISQWKARRWIASAHALELLPLLSLAFSSGQLGIDKLVELTRFAAPDTESNLLRWAKRVSAACIRRRGDLLASPSLGEAKAADRTRSLSWWYFDDNKLFGLEATLPAAQGAVVAKAIQRLSEQIPVMPGEEDGSFAEARRADALVALCSSRIAADADPDRATVVVHAQLERLSSGPAPSSPQGGCEIEDGPVIHPETARRLLCDARIQMVLEAEGGQPVRLGRMMREPPGWMIRQLRYRDLECRFPGCGARRFTQAHHIRWWQHGGDTDLENLLLVCTFHHKLVHEYGWRVRRDADGTARWFRPDGSPYPAGPDPPPDRPAHHQEDPGQPPSLSARGVLRSSTAVQWARGDLNPHGLSPTGS